MFVDCAIIGGGPAGLQAALVLGRARRSVLVFDDNQPRNAVTRESHGFLTRDGIKPAEFRALAQQDLEPYPSVELRHVRVTGIRQTDGAFEITTEQGDRQSARTVVLATGLKEVLPAIEGLEACYGKSVFSCPYCDGWELRDRPLVVISEGPQTFHLVKVVWNWSRDLLLCTNGQQPLTADQRDTLRTRGIAVEEDRITSLEGEEGQLERITFVTRAPSSRVGGFVAPQVLQAAPFGDLLGCQLHGLGGLVTDPFGRTTVPGVYAAGDAAAVMPAKLIIAAAEGSRAAAGVNADLTERDFR